MKFQEKDCIAHGNNNMEELTAFCALQQCLTKMKTAPMLILLFTFAISSCTSQPGTKSITEKSTSRADYEVALMFINNYAKYCDTLKSDDTTWIKNNSLLTPSFKQTYLNLIDSALKADPELGLIPIPFLMRRTILIKDLSLLNMTGLMD